MTIIDKTLALPIRRNVKPFQLAVGSAVTALGGILAIGQMVAALQ